MALVTLDELKTHLRITDTTEDARLTLVLNGAIDLAKKRAGREFETGTYSELVFFQDGIGFVAETPLSAVATVSRDGEEYSVTRFHANGLVQLAGNYTALFTVSYTGGEASIPASLKFGILKLAEWLYSHPEGTSATVFEGFSTTYKDAPTTALELIDTFKRRRL